MRTHFNTGANYSQREREREEGERERERETKKGKKKERVQKGEKGFINPFISIE